MAKDVRIVYEDAGDVRTLTPEQLQLLAEKQLLKAATQGTEIEHSLRALAYCQLGMLRLQIDGAALARPIAERTLEVHRQCFIYDCSGQAVTWTAYHGNLKGHCAEHGIKEKPCHSEP